MVRYSASKLTTTGNCVIGEHRLVAQDIGRVARDAQLKVRTGAAWHRQPVQTVDAALVETAILLLITGPALDQHSRSHVPAARDIEAGRRIVVGVNEKFVEYQGWVSGSVQAEPDVEVAGVIRHMEIRGVHGRGNVLGIAMKQLLAGPVGKAAGKSN